MRKRNWVTNRLAAMAAIIMLMSSLAAAQQTRRPATQRPAPQRPAAQTAPDNNLKIKYKTVTAGQTSESTTMIRGARERSEMRFGYGMDIINITQCDLKRNIQISDKTRKYVISPMIADTSSATEVQPTATASTARTRGGVITYTIKSVDTGERKEMFGFTARHVKTTMTMESSPDACSQVNQKIETDGWYIDFNASFSCDLGRQQMAQPPVAAGGCQDRVRFRQEGTARTGYALSETMTMYGPDGTVMFTSSKDVVELSRDPLDAALFDVPAGYTETKNSQELYGMPSMSDLSQMSQPSTTTDRRDEQPSTNVPMSKAVGAIRIGVVQINNRTDRQVSTESLRLRLIGELQGGGLEAVPLNAMSPIEAEAEAKGKQVDFILYTDIGSMKSSKIGGMFGRVTGVSGAGKTESKLEYKLFAVGEKTARLQSTASGKEEGDEVSAGAAISQEARAVKAAVRK